MVEHRHLTTAVLCSLILLHTALFHNPLPTYHGAFQAQSQIINLAKYTTLSSLALSKVAVPFNDHGSLPEVTHQGYHHALQRLMDPELDSGSEPDDESMEIESSSEGSDSSAGNMKTEMYNDAVFKRDQLALSYERRLRRSLKNDCKNGRVETIFGPESLLKSESGNAEMGIGCHRNWFSAAFTIVLLLWNASGFARPLHKCRTLVVKTSGTAEIVAG
jgi:hypothetical protein